VETRRFVRYAVDRPLTAVVFWDEAPIRTVRGRCRVLGEGGLGATLPDRLDVGEIVRLDVPPVRSLYATVRDARGNQHGFEFLYSQEGQRRAIIQLCDVAAAAERK
jgi:PilZ domain-containing protein